MAVFINIITAHYLWPSKSTFKNLESYSYTHRSVQRYIHNLLLNTPELWERDNETNFFVGRFYVEKEKKQVKY